MPRPSTGPKYLVWSGPNILCQTKIDSHMYCARPRTFCSRPKDDVQLLSIIVNSIFQHQHKNFWSGSNCNSILGLVLAQNILGQGIRQQIKLHPTSGQYPLIINYIWFQLFQFGFIGEFMQQIQLPQPLFWPWLPLLQPGWWPFLTETQNMLSSIRLLLNARLQSPET